MSRTITALLLLLIFLPLLTILGTVQSQQYATTTLTSLVTNTEASTVAVGTQIQTTTQPESRTILSAPVTIPGTHGVCGIYFQQAFNATAGDILSGTLMSNSKVDFYVITDAVFQAWSHQVVAGGDCTPSSTLISQHDATSYNFTATIQSNGLYQIIVSNLSQTVVTAQLSAKLATMGPATVTMTQYSTMMQEAVQTVMQPSTQTVQGASSGPDMVTLAVGVLVAIIVVAALAFLVKKRSHGSATK